MSASPNTRNKYSYKHRGKVYPTLGFFLATHEAILESLGGLEGLKDEGALDSALHAPVRSAGGDDAYHGFLDKVAALGYFLARNHPFTDGNKRTALLTMEQTLEWNAHYLKLTQDAKFIVMTTLASGYLSLEGLKLALIYGCGLDPEDEQL